LAARLQRRSFLTTWTGSQQDVTEWGDTVSQACWPWWGDAALTVGLAPSSAPAPFAVLGSAAVAMAASHRQTEQENSQGGVSGLREPM
jgi:hypothetical protein